LTFNFINAQDVPDRTQQAHGGYHSGLQPMFSVLLRSLLLYYPVSQLECGLPGATLEFGAPEAHKNTYCTVTGSYSFVILTSLCTIIILQ